MINDKWSHDFEFREPRNIRHGVCTCISFFPSSLFNLGLDLLEGGGVAFRVPHLSIFITSTRNLTHRLSRMMSVDMSVQYTPLKPLQIFLENSSWKFHVTRTFIKHINTFARNTESKEERGGENNSPRTNTLYTNSWQGNFGIPFATKKNPPIRVRRIFADLWMEVVLLWSAITAERGNTKS